MVSRKEKVAIQKIVAFAEKMVYSTFLNQLVGLKNEADDIEGSK